MLYALTVPAVRFGLWAAGVRIDVHGLDRLDERQNYLFMPNHISNVDPPLVVAAPLAPGLVVDIGIEEVHDMRPGEAISLRATRGVVALDGEREIEFSPGDELTVRLEWDGPLTLDIPGVMAYAA